MTKTELYNVVSVEVSKVLEESKVAKKHKEAILSIIDNYLKPKSGGGQPMNPPIEIDGVTYYYCRWHQCYEPESDMVMSKGKSKGYCKASISKWNKTNSQIKKLEAEATNALLEGKVEVAQENANKAKELKEMFNLPSFYNYVEDWSNFNKCETEDCIKQIEDKYNELKEIKNG